METCTLFLLPLQAAAATTVPQQQCQVETPKTVKTEQKVKKRSVYDRHPWLKKTEEGYWCAVCRDFGTQLSNGINRGVWVENPLPLTSSNKLGPKADKHASGNSHKLAEAAQRNKPTSSEQDVDKWIRRHATLVEFTDQSAMKSLFRQAYFLFASEIPHNTTWRSLVSTVAACDTGGSLRDFLKSRPNNATYLSSTTVTSILESFGDALSKELTTRMAMVQKYSLMADESTNVNGKSVLSICVRYLQEKDVVEQFLGCWPLFSTKSSDIFDALIAKLHCFGLSPDKLVSVSFDGASNMSGDKGGVQRLFKNINSTVVYVHCRSHLLQLALVNACANVPEVKRVMSVLNRLYSVFSRSYVRLGILEKMERGIDGLSHKLVQSDQTRWLSYEGSVAVILRHYIAICLALEQV